ncbi:sulfite exporter TauE/SafE family protein 2-like isoform X1 [Prosopis cineraria]|uniref:sulfite exporter TauE/SafE family protein 2-like isoform X1 n=1 Tax=Prosopis cineraria TaxID=364024 RepID=UPI00240EB1F8|nr:sulfite exporter TauE/SafE family protein 2-like isoform X1 [Prosopis cineraria]
MNTHSLACCCLVLTFTTSFSTIPSNAKQTPPSSDIFKIHHVWHQVLQRESTTQEFITPHDHSLTSLPIVLAAIFCFIASSIASAGGLGGGGLFIPILTIVAKLDLKTASSLSSFMVTGGSIANVLCNLCRSCEFGGKSLIDYDIALCSEPCMLLGVSFGVICNRVFPEWLITLLFAIFLVWSLCKTCKRGLMLWKIESEEKRKNDGFEEAGKGNFEATRNPSDKENTRLKLPWMKLGALLLVWLSFFSLYFLQGNGYGQSIIHMKPCGVGHWILSSAQVPLAVIFTAWIVFSERSLQPQTQTQQGQDLCRDAPSKKLLFPLMALLAGILGGVFGIGGGMLVSPFLLQVGIGPEITAATCSFMVLFSSTMSTLQYGLMGMEDIKKALILSTISFVASLVGLLVLQRAVRKYKRASLIVFSISVVMALSIVLMTSYGVIDVWRDYKSGKHMGFKALCKMEQSS